MITKLQAKRCLKLANLMETELTDEGYLHKWYYQERQDGSTTVCAAGFAILNKKRHFPGLTANFANEHLLPSLTVLKGIDNINTLDHYFGAGSMNRIFSAANTYDRRDVIDALRIFVRYNQAA